MTWYGTMVVQGDGMQGNGMQWYGMCSTIRRIYACLSVYSHACMCMHAPACTHNAAPACTHNALRSAGMLCTANANNKRYINIIKIMIMIIVIVIIHTHIYIYHMLVQTIQRYDRFISNELLHHPDVQC